MEPYEASWKNYYKILRVSPDAEGEAIEAAYERLAYMCHNSLSDKTIKETLLLSVIMNGLNEAYEVLADPARREIYDETFRTKCDSQEAEAEEPGEEQIEDLIALIVEDMSTKRKGKGWRAPGRSKTQRAVLIALTSLLIIIAGGSSLAFAGASVFGAGS